MIALGIFAAALFYGDSMITPAISVLSAVEGLEVVTPRSKPYVLPITCAVLAVLFWIQSRGTGTIGLLFGPIMCVWFACLGVLGMLSIVETPAVLQALNPIHAVRFILANPMQSFLALGAVVLAVTGGEALYTDMGHFGRFPIRLTWFGFVMPALILNYYGQGALLLREHAAVQNPFFLLAPSWAILPLVILATMATVIASQAVISGLVLGRAASVQLGYLPRMAIVQTSHQERGQIYVPFTNLTLFLAVMALVIVLPVLEQSGRCLRHRRHRHDDDRHHPGHVRDDPDVAVEPLARAAADGGVLTGRLRLLQREHHQGHAGRVVPALHRDPVLHGAHDLEARARAAVPPDVEARRLGEGVPRQASTTACRAWRAPPSFMTARADLDPLRVAPQPEAQPRAARAHRDRHGDHGGDSLRSRTIERVELTSLGKGFYRLLIRYGFMEAPDVPAALELCRSSDFPVDLKQVSFFVSRETILPSLQPGISIWREKLFALMSRNAQNATDFFKIPTDNVVELGTQVEI